MEYTYTYNEIFKNKDLKSFLNNKNVVYKISNKINNKMYIGQSTNVYNRWLKHVNFSINSKEYNKEYNNPLQKDIRLFGKDCFEFTILEFCEKTDLDDREFFYIEKFNSHNIGYNSPKNVAPNTNFFKLDHETLRLLIVDLKDSKLYKSEIAKKYNISIQNLNSINRGSSLKKENVDYPIRTISEYDLKVLKGLIKKATTYCICGNKKSSNAKKCLRCYESEKCEHILPKEHLLDLLNYFPFTYVGELCNVSDNAIRKWCKKHNMSTKARDYKKRSE